MAAQYKAPQYNRKTMRDVTTQCPWKLHFPCWTFVDKIAFADIDDDDDDDDGDGDDDDDDDEDDEDDDEDDDDDDVDVSLGMLTMLEKDGSVPVENE